MRLNPYRQTELWHKIMMTTKYRCTVCDSHAVVVEDGQPRCVWHNEDTDHSLKRRNWS